MKKNKLIQLAIKFSPQEVEEIGDLTTDRIKKLVWLYSQYPVFINFCMKDTVPVEQLEEVKTFYIQFRHEGEIEALAPFSKKRSRFVRHLMLNEALILKAIGERLGTEDSPKTEVPVLTKQLQEVTHKLNHIEELVLHNCQIPPHIKEVRTRPEVKDESSAFKAKREEYDLGKDEHKEVKTHDERSIPAPPSRQDIQQKRQLLPPSTTGRSFS
ncbi:hypothetical protein QR692_09995 [Lactococcus petauri]|uniref:hypothetical protein n=1 Tax=Lactococcus petauri TaxID=1940789 RepID=UPI002078ED55|nr:hypothetical protein [Lactococcus petauri]USI65313.1 hypothetical protein LMK05_10880 [Lactococcus petauri]USI67808.1 hypothetical protein LMK04_10115 [Lactococcus petauri]WJE12469.1 hypothetical protein QR692_09995 [Lactococcus petauri]